MNWIRKERIRGTSNELKKKVREISKKVEERNFLRWYGHVMRCEENCVGREVREERKATALGWWLRRLLERVRIFF